jgi:hypothetical protein
MHRPKVAVLCYLIALGFILAVAFHSSTKLLVAADTPPVSGVK